MILFMKFLDFFKPSKLEKVIARNENGVLVTTIKHWYKTYQFYNIKEAREFRKQNALVERKIPIEILTPSVKQELKVKIYNN